MASQFVKRALEHINNSFGVSAYPVGDMSRLIEFTREHASDRRFRVQVLAMSGNRDRLDSALVVYRGVKYYAYFDKPVGEFIVEVVR